METKRSERFWIVFNVAWLLLFVACIVFACFGKGEIAFGLMVVCVAMIWR